MLQNSVNYKIKALLPPSQYSKKNRMQNQAEIVSENLYEIPSCTICLSQLTEDLSSLSCGHVFHISCITQHFQYKGTCPNCQKRAQLKEIRLVVYPVVQNTKTVNYLRALLANIDKSQGQQVQGLLTEIKLLSEKSEKLEYQVKQSQKNLGKRSEELQKIKREIQLRTEQVANLRRQNIKLKKQLSQQKLDKEKIQFQLINLSDSYGSLLASKRQIQQYKIIQKAAAQNSHQLIKYKQQLESKKTPAETIAKQFFEMLQLKNLAMLRIKQKQKQSTQRYKYKEDENVKLKGQIQELKKEIEASQAEISKWKSKSEKIRDRYKQVLEKSKSKQESGEMCQEMSENSQSVSLGLSNRIGFKNNAPAAVSSEKAEKQLTFNIIEKPKNTQPKIMFGNQALKKQIEQKKQITLKNFMN